jgi:hypothetical protein
LTNSLLNQCSLVETPCLLSQSSGQDSLLAQPMFPAKTPCLLSQCFRPRLLACLANASGKDSLLAQPMLPAKTLCFVGLLE